MGRGPAVIVENRGKTQKSMVLRAGVVDGNLKFHFERLNSTIR